MLTIARYATRLAKVARSWAPKPNRSRTWERKPSAPIRRSASSRIWVRPHANPTETRPPSISKPTTCRAERQFDARLLVNRVDERALQIGAMNNQIRRAPAAFGALQRHPHKFSVIGTSQHDDGLRPRGKRQHAF